MGIKMEPPDRLITRQFFIMQPIENPITGCSLVLLKGLKSYELIIFDGHFALNGFIYESNFTSGDFAQKGLTLY